MKKILLIIPFAILLLLGIIAFDGPQKSEANISSLNQRQLVGTERATTTPIYFTTSTATTSYAFYVERADSFQLHLALKASTTATQLQYTVDYSDDNIDWYGEDSNSTASGVTTHLAEQPIHIWVPANASASTTRRNFQFSNTGSRYARVNFNVKGAAAGIWATVVTKEQIQ